jgi:transcriptional regulator with XRE-family HTH domain
MQEQIVTSVKSDPEIRTRLKEEFKRLGVSIEEVADASAIAKGTLDNIMSGRTDSMKDVHLSLLWKAYPSLNILYVLTGNRNANADLLADIGVIDGALGRIRDRLS